MIADDHSLIRNALCNIFNDTDDIRVVAEATNGNAVLQQIRKRAFDLLILDLSMPGRSGLELLKLVKTERPDMPVLIFTAHPDELYAVRAIRAGATGYLTKDCESDTLLSTVRKLAAGGVYASSRVAELLVTSLSRPSAALPHTLLSDREYEVFSRLVRGMNLTAIAKELGVSIKTVSTHKSHILSKMDSENEIHLTCYAIGHGLLEIMQE